ncbi:membrane protein FAM174A isoform X1 [Melozone crissalis]|uniref:membrane protein FAM174A isoform X1 n=1 Tax=Melozone crissalis TaxID=40204 RepID=UPI0023DCA7E9|nr:membrane protein FAM174A isoform X1 [Melozone crissalis]
MRSPTLPQLLVGPLLVLLVLLEAARCAEAAAPRPRDATTASPRSTEAASGASTRSSSNSSSSSSRLAEVSAPPEQGQPMTQRALSVLVLASAALIVYFVIRTVRLRRQNRKTRRYGVLDMNIENMELTPLEQDDDDDDTTLFDASHPRRIFLVYWRMEKINK